MPAEPAAPLYDEMGRGYARRRRPDPNIARRIYAAVGDSATIVNVGAGSGSYEPSHRRVLAVEPSATMIRQRARDAAPAVLGRAEALPLVDQSVDAAMAVLTVHHWTDLARGVAEMVRVARERVVIVTFDPAVVVRSWLRQHYLPELAALDRRLFPPLGRLHDLLPAATTEVLAVPVACRDGFLEAYWGRPEAYLDPAVRAATSGFARLGDAARSGLAQLQADLSSGPWDERHGRLRHLPSYDVGLRIIVGWPNGPAADGRRMPL